MIDPPTKSRSEQVAPARIGSGVALFWIDGLFLAFGMFAAMAGAGGSEGATAVGDGAFVVGGGIVAIGFWVNLFSKIEARLIDIQIALALEGPAGAAHIEPPNAGSPHVIETNEELMTKYGISFDGTKYHYGEYTYDKLTDAAGYAARNRK